MRLFQLAVGLGRSSTTTHGQQAGAHGCQAAAVLAVKPQQRRRCTRSACPAAHLNGSLRRAPVPPSALPSDGAAGDDAPGPLPAAGQAPGPLPDLPSILPFDPYGTTFGPALPCAPLAAIGSSLPSISDTNTLQTALAAAICAEDFTLAASIRDRLKEVMGGSSARIDWSSIPGLPTWLVDRAQRLGFRFPTEVQRRACGVIACGADAVVGSETGSGKTLSYLMPLLARLRYPPEVFLEDMKGPQALILVPTLELGAQVAMAAYRLLGGTLTSASNARPGDEANMYTYEGPKGIKVRGIMNREEMVMAKNALGYLAQVHIVVATPAALLEAISEPDPQPNLLKHLQVLVVDEVDECFLSTGQELAVVLEAATSHSAKATAGAGTEASQGAPAEGASPEAAAAAAGAEGQRSTPQVVFVGATQRPEAIELSCQMGWLQDPVVVQVGQAGGVPSGLRHRYLVVEPARRLAALVRSLRRDLREGGPDAAPARVVLFANDGPAAIAIAEPLMSALWTDHRMAVLLPPGARLQSPADTNEAAAASGLSADELDAMDEIFAYDPLRALQLFRDHKASLLLATAAAARGLDLPAVSHVYNLGVPPDTTQYLHRAGRAGRIGSMTGGTVTSVVSPEEVPALLRLASELGIEMVQQQEEAGDLERIILEQQQQGGDAAGAAPPAVPALGGDIDKLRKGLEDLFTLM